MHSYSLRVWVDDEGNLRLPLMKSGYPQGKVIGHLRMRFALEDP